MSGAFGDEIQFHRGILLQAIKQVFGVDSATGTNRIGALCNLQFTNQKPQLDNAKGTYWGPATYY